MRMFRGPRKALLLALAWTLLSSGSADASLQGGAVRVRAASDPPAGSSQGQSQHKLQRLQLPAEPSVDENAFSAQTRKRKKRNRAKPISWVALQQQYPGSFVIWGPRRYRRVALTFDDVPDPRYTPQVLETLARYKVRATFFVVGQRAAAHPALVRRMVREGHIVGNHSLNHPVFSRISLYAMQQQISRTDWTLRPLVGYSPRFVRPPYGEIVPAQVEWLRSQGYTVVNWDVDSQDWRSLDSQSILINIRRTLQPGSIILQHAGGGEGQDLSGTIAALPRLIKLLRSKGYVIVTLPELLGRPAGRKLQ
ncbi:polysaccharide deacetylase family protein [Paenibacillus rhizovicinus]|uniref:Polysaccharide deacetylase family protein n=1 Tax=Paenibacillus rhizovicinus TaxID=2704463 RepID=A0A6C0NX35_9BACL|nr:polysaccharide deacetylase family protein [Paenibacillus rhizovicinus]QHW30777.1 polysaccharide deacetylase family protein [Paenibacillus rhizovicinus]